MNKIINHIKNNWDATIRNSETADKSALVKLPKPYTVPCADKMLFVSFFYWDTYFTNIGLIRTGRYEQALNNIDNMRFLADTYGYVPNADFLIDRSQPPLYARAVFDCYEYKKDKELLKKHLPALLKEYEFWQARRITPCGLNRYGYETSERDLITFYTEVAPRVCGDINIPDKQKLFKGKHLMAIAESGWDFNPRFKTEEYGFACCDFAGVDLNSILYDVEIKTAYFCGELGDMKKKDEFERAAAKRKKLMNSLMKEEKTGILKDYNYKTGKLSSVYSGASFYPFCMGVSEDKRAAEILLGKLELPFGLSVCEYRENADFLQWDYPMMWPPVLLFAVLGLKAAGFNISAERVARKYQKTVEEVFEKTGHLWEKYDCVSGAQGLSYEYETPPMIGWTAGVYVELCGSVK